MTTNTHITVTLTPELRLKQALKQAGIKSPKTITRLTVAGTFTIDDLEYFREKMGKTLRELDMSNASIENSMINIILLRMHQIKIHYHSRLGYRN